MMEPVIRQHLQYEACFCIIQSGECGDYDGFYLMKGCSVPVKNY